MPFTSLRIITVDIIVFVKNNSPIKMDKFLKKKREIECNLESRQTSNVESCSSKKAKPRLNRKYDVSYLSFGFSWTGNVDNPQPVCLVWGIKMSYESMLPSKLGKHFKSKHSFTRQSHKLF